MRSLGRVAPPTTIDLARETGQALDLPARRRARRGPRSGRPSRPRGRSRARPRRPSGTAAASSAARAPERRRLVRREPDAVPGPVAEMVAVAGRLDDVAGDAVDRPPGRQRRRSALERDRRLERVDRRRLGPRDELVDRRGRARSARRRTASASCRCGSPPTWAPKSNSRTAPVRTAGRRGAVRQRGLRARPGRRRRTRAPRRRRSASATRAGARARPRSRPARISGSSAASARSATAHAAAIRSSSAGSLIARSASTQPSTGTSSTSGAAAASRCQVACGTNPASTADAPRPDRRQQLRPARRQVVVGLDEPRLRRLAARLDRVARVGEDHDLVGADEELAGVAGDLLLAVAEREPGQVAHVLAPDAEVGVDAGLREPRPQAAEAGRAGGPVGLGPARAVGRGRRRGEVGRRGQAPARARGSRWSHVLLDGWPRAP